ncbi:SDR family NAD(P)-dependent oxidoreductase [Parabacteroides bouchesdurhonensis]|uniref:SDR family NAD(P)-dependent oxidoreductase n=1 Tax=Parabacteroides bouchesdurhonensis TaxID=1936995 RepID=UPI000E506414|nr:SDR family NAD(P)-dependent oxidoreductase [Parabacteroides bouchesdurhonensis]RHJ93626.1 SDR family NAD(P)-dependent oxidoreductase [Bacteroides sp. AM07-16]
MKRIVIIGATSGIGNEVAKIYLEQGCRVGAAGRRQKELEELKALFPGQVEIQPLDVTESDAPEKLQLLIDKLGGMDLFLLSSGVGSQNLQLDPAIELKTASTNVDGFIRMVTAAFDYFKKQGGGHLAVISSIAGTKGLGSAPAYSATKRFQNTYIEALEQLSYMEKLNICFTDIRPGFVATALLKDNTYPMLMMPADVARYIVKALKKKQHVVTIDICYAVLVFFWRMIPRWLWRRLPIKTKHQQ